MSEIVAGPGRFDTIEKALVQEWLVHPCTVAVMDGLAENIKRQERYVIESAKAGVPSTGPVHILIANETLRGIFQEAASHAK